MKSRNPNAAPLLSLDNLSVTFRTSRGAIRAVRGLDLELRRGEILAIVGESGSGKSVTAQAIMGLLPAHATVDYGAISFKGRPLSALTPAEWQRYRGGSVGMIFQEPSSSFDPLYPIGKALREAILAHAPAMATAEVDARCIRLLSEIGIKDAPHRLRNYPHQFSGGQLQRISLALAIAADPEALLADEPTTALDVTVQAEIIALLKRIIAHRSLSAVFISHDIALVASIADRIAVMYNGSVLEIGACADIIHSPHHPYSAALLQSVIPFGIHYRDSKLKTIRGAPPSPFAEIRGCPFAERCDYVRPNCRLAVPPLIAASPPSDSTRPSASHLHRCLLPGVKSQ